MAIRTDSIWILKKRQKFLQIGKLSNGFTLVELLVVIGMLAILMLSLIFTFNPLTQFNKAQDSQRQHDLAQIQRAVDTYFNDTGCYPSTIPFGKIWKSSQGQIYMEQVPQDPKCSSDPNKCYVYITDPNTTCPQWNVLLGAMRGPMGLQNACPLVTKTSGSINCLPNGFGSSGYNYCLLSGSIDCSVVSGTIVGGSGGSGGGGGGGGGGGTTPTPTPGALVCSGSNYYACTSPTNGNPNGSCNSIGLVNGSPTQCSGYGGTYTCVCASNCAGLPCAF